MNLETLGISGPFEDRPDRRVLDLVDMFHTLDTRIHNAVLVLKERRKVAASNVAVLVNGCGQYGPAVFSEPSRIVGAAAEK